MPCMRQTALKPIMSCAEIFVAITAVKPYCGAASSIEGWNRGRQRRAGECFATLKEALTQILGLGSATR